MIIMYKFAVNSLDIILRSLPPEIRKTDLVIVYSIHNSNLEVANADVISHNPVTFIVEVPLEELRRDGAIMTIAAYKYHPTGTKIMIGSVTINLNIFIVTSIITDGEYVPIPGNFILINPAKVAGALLRSTVELAVLDES